MALFNKKDKRLGVSEGKRRYDLPLNKDHGSRFLVTLIALMTFLATMALAFSFSLGGLVDKWSSGLENKLTIEIPAEDSKGNILERNVIQEHAKKIASLLEENKALQTIEVLDDQALSSLLEPWMGDQFIEDSPLSGIPVPALISAEIVEGSDLNIKKLEEHLQESVDGVHIDKHEEWLVNLLRLTSSMQFSSLIVVCVIIATTLLAVAGAIRSRMAEFKGDVELLHLIGANDEYITQQFQRHARIIGLQGGIIGLALSLLSIAAYAFFMQEQEQAFMPELKLFAVHYVTLAFVPVFMCFVTSACSRYTVLRVLAKMP